MHVSIHHGTQLSHSVNISIIIAFCPVIVLFHVFIIYNLTMYCSFPNCVISALAKLKLILGYLEFWGFSTVCIYMYIIISLEMKLVFPLIQMCT